MAQIGAWAAVELTVAAVLPSIRAEGYASHALHSADRHWPTSNCHVDLWIEVLSSLGHDPCAALGFTARLDFEGDQFTFAKVPSGDLDLLFGIDVQELVVYRPLEEHVRERISLGQLPIVEVDGFYLPDTRGTSYRRDHSKTTIAVNRIDVGTRNLEYFHNEGCFRLTGADFDGLLGRQTGVTPTSTPTLPPYFEFAKLNTHQTPAGLAHLAIDRLRHHLARTPVINPFKRFGSFLSEIGQRIGGCQNRYHQIAFVTTRQAGASFELLASHLGWIARNNGPRAEAAMAALLSGAENLTRLQFQMARAVNPKAELRFDRALESLAATYEALFEDLRRTFGRVETTPRGRPRVSIAGTA